MAKRKKKANGKGRKPPRPRRRRTDVRVIGAIEATLTACGGEDAGWDSWANAWLDGDRKTEEAHAALCGSIGFHRGVSMVAGPTDPRAARANVRVGAAMLALATKRDLGDTLMLVDVALEVLKSEETQVQELLSAWARLHDPDLN